MSCRGRRVKLRTDATIMALAIDSHSFTVGSLRRRRDGPLAVDVIFINLPIQLAEVEPPIPTDRIGASRFHSWSSCWKSVIFFQLFRQVLRRPTASPFQSGASFFPERPLTYGLRAACAGISSSRRPDAYRKKELQRRKTFVENIFKSCGSDDDEEVGLFYERVFDAVCKACSILAT